MSTLRVGAAPKTAPVCKAGVYALGDDANDRYPHRDVAFYLEFFSACHTFTEAGPPDKITYVGVHGMQRVEYRRGKQLGAGSYGSVYEYVAPAPEEGLPPLFALKHIRHMVAEEDRALALLNRRTKKLAAQHKVNADCYLMAACDGDLWGYACGPRSPPLPVGVVIHIMRACLRLLEELWASGIAYMDVKAANMLYVACPASGAIDPDMAYVRVMLGDLGSVIMRVDNQHVAVTTTFLRPADCFPRHVAATTADGILWCVAVMGLELMHQKVEPYAFENVYKRLYEGDTRESKAFVQEELFVNMRNAVYRVCDAQGLPSDACASVSDAFEALSSVHKAGYVFGYALDKLRDAEVACDNVRPVTAPVMERAARALQWMRMQWRPTL